MDPLTPQQAKKMKVAELKDALASRGASTSGLKPALQQRLLDLLEAETSVPNVEEEASDNVDQSTSAPMEDAETTDNPSEGTATAEKVIEATATQEVVTSKEDSDVADSSSASTKESVEENAAPTHASRPSSSKYEPPTQENIENVPDATTHHATPSSLAVEEDDDEEVQELRAAEERKLREEVLRSMAKKKLKASAPSPVSASETRPPTTHLRVDHFQRPLNPKHLREWILDIAGVSLLENGLWLNPIKTHGYMDFSSVDDAVSCRNALTSRRWPDTNPQTLVANFVTISASQAANAPEAALQYADWVAYEQSGVIPVAAKKTESPRVRPTSGAADMLRNAAGAAAASAATATEAAKARALERRRVEVAADGGYTTKRMKPNPDEEIEAATPRNSFLSRLPATSTPRGARDRQPQTKSLDELFKKTVAVPPLYWLPLTEEEVNAKKNGRTSAHG